MIKYYFHSQTVIYVKITHIQVFVHVKKSGLLTCNNLKRCLQLLKLKMKQLRQLSS